MSKNFRVRDQLFKIEETGNFYEYLKSLFLHFFNFQEF